MCTSSQEKRALNHVKIVRGGGGGGAMLRLILITNFGSW